MAESRIDELRRRLERDPASRLFAQLAEEHRRLGAHQEAVRVARAGLVHHPTYPSARLTLGRALQDSGDAAAARVELEEAVRQAPDNIVARRCLGQVLETVGELAGAVEHHAAALRMSPGDQGLQRRLRELVDRLSSEPAPGAAVSAEPTEMDEAPATDETAEPAAVEEEPEAVAAGSVSTIAPEPDSAAPAAAARGGHGDARDLADVSEVEGTEVGDAAGSHGTPFSSSTLAELYHRQGLRERAVEVYREVLAADPENERARVRIQQIVAEQGGGPDGGGANGRAARQRAIERTISGLEVMLQALRRR